MSTYGVETKCIVVDFCDGRSNYERIKEELRDVPVGILGELPEMIENTCTIFGTLAIQSKNYAK